MAYKIKSVKKLSSEEKNILIRSYYNKNSIKVYGKPYNQLSYPHQEFIREYSYKSLNK